jgi:hypothetical protein
MTPEDFRLSLGALSDLLAQAGSPSVATDLRKLAEMFEVCTEKTASAALKRLSKLSVQSSAQSNSLLKLLPLLKASEAFVRQASGTKYISLFESFTAIVQSNASVSPRELVEGAVVMFRTPSGKVSVPPRDLIVGGWVKRLEDALGHDGFADVHRQLGSDLSVTAAEMTAIAKAFAAKKPVGRAKALQAIWGRNHALMTFRSKADSRAGRSAA